MRDFREFDFGLRRSVWHLTKGKWCSWSYRSSLKFGSTRRQPLQRVQSETSDGKDGKLLISFNENRCLYRSFSLAYDRAQSSVLTTQRTAPETSHCLERKQSYDVNARDALETAHVYVFECFLWSWKKNRFAFIVLLLLLTLLFTFEAIRSLSEKRRLSPVAGESGPTSPPQRHWHQHQLAASTDRRRRHSTTAGQRKAGERLRREEYCCVDERAESPPEREQNLRNFFLSRSVRVSFALAALCGDDITRELTRATRTRNFHSQCNRIICVERKYREN